MDYYNPAGIAHKLIFTGFSSCSSARSCSGAAASTRRSTSWSSRPDKPFGAVYEFAKDCPATGVVGGALVFFYYRLVAKPKRMTLTLEGLLILGIIFTMMSPTWSTTARRWCSPRRRRRLCDGAAHAGGQRARVRVHRDHRRARSAGEHFDGDWSLWPAPAGSLFALLFALACRRDAHRPRARRLLDALDAGADLPEPPAALEALPHHHGDPERLRAEPAPGRAPQPMAENAEKLDGEGRRGRRGAGPAGAAASASRASSTSPGRRSSTSTRAPSAAAARTTAPRTAPARSSARST